MQDGRTVLAIISERGKKGLPLERVYRHLFNRDLYLMAYGKIYRNAGALTPGSTPETADDMSLRKIEAIIEAVRYERYRWTPTRRVYIEKPHSTKKRPLSMPTWSDKLLQEVIRLILESYYEPQMSNCSHGFRPGKGCHTALQDIDRTWLGTTWYLEGDIQACFDSLDHQILLDTLAEKIRDGRFLRLIRGLLQAGYLEDWKYNATLSGAPQGGIVSPILSNIYLTKLDNYIEQTLIPAYTKGTKRQPNPKYNALLNEAARLRRRGQHQEAKEARQRAQQLPSVDPDDPEYRRMKYVRYADDWLVGFIGSRAEVEEIKRQIGTFLRDELKLTLSEKKTLITHARTEAARFLGYHISTMQANTYRPHGKRYVNGKVELRMPEDVLKQKCERYLKHGKPIHRMELETETAYSIMSRYQSEYRGLVEYYQMANNLNRLGYLRWIMEQSLTKTLAAKLKISVAKVYKRYRATHIVDGRPYKGLAVVVEREGKQPLTAKWGNIPLRGEETRAILNDQPGQVWTGHPEFEKRLLADTCELCGSHDRISVHHIRALKDLHQKGRREKPRWMHVMASRRRKTLVVCWSCHMDIQHGRPRKTAKNRNNVLLESRILGNS
ncbi:MAG TPA: reverse transcriptase domain-containing protein [Ktedonobacteraceae bacterium]